jgi:phosphate transport system substrate-binding protein
MRSDSAAPVALAALATIVAGMLVAGCAGSGNEDNTSGASSGGATSTTSSAPASSQGASVELTGAGSTFDQPYFQKAFYEYHSTHPNVTVNYQSIGSGGGIKEFTAGHVDFGASDVPMNPKELQGAEASGGPVIQLPVCLGAATVSYNLPGIKAGLKLTPKAIADIYLGKVTMWNDPEITALNPGVKLPAQHMTVVHRSDGSGTTYIFTDYLAHVSPEWKAKVGCSKTVNWPVGVGGKGNPGVANNVSKTVGAIGYVELAYVLQTHMTAADVQNKAGAYVSPTLDSTKAAAAQFPNVSPTDFSIVDAPGQDSYPISGYSWVLLYQSPKDPTHTATILDVMKWLCTDAQDQIAGTLEYVPLPKNVQAQATAGLEKIKA